MIPQSETELEHLQKHAEDCLAENLKGHILVTPRLLIELVQERRWVASFLDATMGHMETLRLHKVEVCKALSEGRAHPDAIRQYIESEAKSLTNIVKHLEDIKLKLDA